MYEHRYMMVHGLNNLFKYNFIAQRKQILQFNREIIEIDDI